MMSTLISSGTRCKKTFHRLSLHSKILLKKNPKRKNQKDLGTRLPPYNSLMKKNVISISRDVMGGTPVFSGTRVPVETFFDYIEGQETRSEERRVGKECRSRGWPD